MKPSYLPRLDTGNEWQEYHGCDLAARLHHRYYRKVILEAIEAWYNEIEKAHGTNHANSSMAMVLAHYIEVHQGLPSEITIEL